MFSFAERNRYFKNFLVFRISQSAKHIQAKPNSKVRGVVQSALCRRFATHIEYSILPKHIAQSCTKATQRKVSPNAFNATQTFQLRCNKALHPTAYAPVVPPFAAAAGELVRCVAARGLLEARQRKVRFSAFVQTSSTRCVVTHDAIVDSELSLPCRISHIYSKVGQSQTSSLRRVVSCVFTLSCSRVHRVLVVAKTQLAKSHQTQSSQLKHSNCHTTRRCTRPPTASFLRSFLTSSLRFRRRVSLVVLPSRATWPRAS